jgi:hypothetical protein
LTVNTIFTTVASVVNGQVASKFPFLFILLKQTEASGVPRAAVSPLVAGRIRRNLAGCRPSRATSDPQGALASFEPKRFAAWSILSQRRPPSLLDARYGIDPNATEPTPKNPDDTR